MISAAVLFLFLGLIVFGPKKTVEFAQTIGRLLAQLKQTTGQFQSQLQEEVRTQNKAHDGSKPQSAHLPSAAELTLEPVIDLKDIPT